ncbi:MAG: hypothetical protein ABIO88_02255 [Burkholderiaceae bacterium]
MKTLSLRTLAIVSGLACLNVYPVVQAQSADLNYPPKVKFNSTLSRDAVRTEYIQAAQEGTLYRLGEVDSAPTIASFQSSKTRDDVNTEYLQALKDGSLPQLDEGSSAIAATTLTSPLSREAVVAETLDWIRAQHSDVMMGGN